MIDYTKNHCFSNHSPVLQCKSSIVSITQRYPKHLSSFKRKAGRKRKAGAVGRPFKLDVKNRSLMLLVYYRLYITYTLAGFLFDLDQSNICCRDIQKIEPLIRNCLPIPQ